MCCLLVVAVATQCVAALSWGHDSYQLTEWLINYAGGFVRRGLPGELIWQVSALTGMQANHLALGVSLACYIGLTVWFLKNSRAIFPPILLLSCLMMGFPAYQDSILRKDCLCLLLLLLCLKIDDSAVSRTAKFGLVNITAAVGALTHEAFVFYALPAMVLYQGKQDAEIDFKSLIFRGLRVLPMMACFGLTLVFHGTPAVARAVHESWLPLWQMIDPGNPAVNRPAAAIEALGWTSAQGMHLALHMLTSGIYQPAAWAMVFAASSVLIILFCGRDAETHDRRRIRSRVAAVMAVQLACISPLFILGVDYGRWLFLWLASTAMVCTLRPVPPRWLDAGFARLYNTRVAERISGWLPARDWYLLVFGVPVCWNLHNFLTASPLGRHIDLIRSWF